MIIKFLSVIWVFIYFTGCATPFKGRTEEISFGSGPQRAMIFVNTVDMGETPLTLKSEKSKAIEEQKRTSSIPLDESKEVIVHLKDGNVIRGTIIDQDENSITLKTAFGDLTIEKENIKLIEPEAKTVMINLKDGAVLKGKILSQDEQFITIETSLGQLKIERKNILKIEDVKETWKNEKKYGEEKAEKKVPINETEEIKEKTETNKELPPKSRKIEESITPNYQYHKKTELSINIGGGFFGLDSSSTYSDSGSMFLITNFQERSVLNSSSKNGIFLGGSLSYFVNKNFGIQASVGYIQSKVPSKTAFDFKWTWYDGSSYSKQENWDGNGDLSSMPISFNFVGKFGEKAIKFYISGGYTLFSNKFRADSFMGMVLSDIETYYLYGIEYYIQYVDGLKVPVRIEESWNSSGFNVGGGLDISLSDNLALNIDGRYYSCPSKKLAWTYVTGNYDGLYGDYNWSVGRDAAEYYRNNTSPLDARPSFFHISGGIKFLF